MMVVVPVSFEHLHLEGCLMMHSIHDTQRHALLSTPWRRKLVIFILAHLVLSPVSPSRNLNTLRHCVAMRRPCTACCTCVAHSGSGVSAAGDMIWSREHRRLGETTPLAGRCLTNGTFTGRLGRGRGSDRVRTGLGSARRLPDESPIAVGRRDGLAGPFDRPSLVGGPERPGR